VGHPGLLTATLFSPEICVSVSLHRSLGVSLLAKLSTSILDKHHLGNYPTILLYLWAALKVVFPSRLKEG
jgi:hypothetical protein